MSKENKEKFGPYLCDGLKRENLTDQSVLRAMSHVPRHRFVPQDLEQEAYADKALAIGHGQTISQPFIVALMTQEAKIYKGCKVLDVGMGSGYQTAVLAELGADVYAMEIVPELYDKTSALLEELSYTNLNLYCGDGRKGLKNKAPFDVIIVAAAAEEPPTVLLQQLAEGGRMIIPLKNTQEEGELLMRITREGDGFEMETLLAVKFVPLTYGKEHVKQIVH